MRRACVVPTACLLAAALALAGCSPMVTCTVETQVYPDYTCRRATRLDGVPNPRFPGQRPRLSDFFSFPPPERYDAYNAQGDRAMFAGTFESFDMIPPDLVRITPGVQQRAGNRFSFRVMDFVLFVLADFDETLTDIVQSQADGEAALDELVRLLAPEVMSVLNARYGAKFDLSRLESWIMNDLPQKLKRLYAGAWAIHRAKRSGVTSPGEDYELYMFIKAEARREGLELGEPGVPGLQEENMRRLREYAVRLTESLCPPRQPGGATVGAEVFGKVTPEEILAAVQKAVIARHGSINGFIAKISSAVPRAFGAYLTGSVMPLYMLPDTTYQYRLRTPGRVLQTNGVVDVNGDMVWSFMDRDLAFTGQSMWARTIFIREPVTYTLGLRGFPASLEDVDAMFGLCLTPTGEPREAILAALQQAAVARSLSPLETLAASADAPDAQSAREILALFGRHRKNSAAAPPAAPALPASPQPPPAQPQPPPQPQRQPPAPMPDPASMGGAAPPARPAIQPLPPAVPTPAPPAPVPPPANRGTFPAGGLEPPALPPPIR